jgi:penicillin-binding protein 1C
MIEAYAMIARGGVKVRSTERVISERTAFFLTDILSDNDARAFIFGRGGSLEFPFPVAAKTGTSQAYRDNWAFGFTRDVTVGVWVGNFDRTPMRGSSGVTGAGPIFHEVMMAAVELAGGPRNEDAPLIAPTGDVRRETLCAMSGLVAGDACPTRVDEWVPAEARIARCSWHHASDEGLITVWPDEYRTWAIANGQSAKRQSGIVESGNRESMIGESGIGELKSGESGIGESKSGKSRIGESASGLRIASPLGGATYMYDPTLRAEFQTLKLRARGAAGGDVVWEVDGTRVGTTGPDRTIEWPLRRGAHQIVAIDAAGTRATTKITVR